MLEFYSNYQRYYRHCQEVARTDSIITKDGSTRDPRETLFDNLDKIVEEYRRNDGKMRLLLPDPLLKESDALLIRFNEFRKAAKGGYGRDDLLEIFEKINDQKKVFEIGLKKLLRVHELWNE